MVKTGCEGGRKRLCQRGDLTGARPGWELLADMTPVLRAHLWWGGVVPVRDLADPLRSAVHGAVTDDALEQRLEHAPAPRTAPHEDLEVLPTHGNYPRNQVQWDFESTRTSRR